MGNKLLHVHHYHEDVDVTDDEKGAAESALEGCINKAESDEFKHHHRASWSKADFERESNKSHLEHSAENVNPNDGGHEHHHHFHAKAEQCPGQQAVS